MDETKLYADQELDNDDYFVVTPEGNKFNFPYPEYSERHDETFIVDPMSHKTYTVVFDE